MNIKTALITLIVFATAGIVGWGTYTLAGPGHSHSHSDSHEGHKHGGNAHAHPHGEEEEGARSSSDGHRHEHGEEDEDLDGLFAKAADSSERLDEEHGAHTHHAHDGDDHHDHPSHASERRGGHDPHDHEDHGHGHGDRHHAGHDHAAHRPHGHGPGDGICPDHNVPESEDALCHPDLVSHLRPGEGMKVRLSAPETARRVGIVAATPLPAQGGGAAWPGQVVFNRDRLARLTALAGGTVQKVNVKLGERVERGQILAEIAAPEAAGLRAELAASESRLALAEAVYQREKDLLERGITSRHEFQQAEAEFRQAQSAAVRAHRQMEDFGLASGSAGSILPIRAPFAGTVIERTAVLGEAVPAGETLFTLADLNTLWVEISIPEDSLLSVHSGMEIVASFPGLPGRAFPGKVFWISPALDQRTRMLKVLAEVDNQEALLRSGLFGEVSAARTGGRGELSVPADALQSVDGQPFLFVILEDDLFELRRVTAGRRSGGSVVIHQGLHSHDRVVTTQAFSLKSEVLRARLGASCADH